MFIIRTAFWLSLVILLLPAEDPPQAHDNVALQESQELSATSVFSAAQTTLSDISGICERSPDVCEIGSAALDVFIRKAQYGANRVLAMLSEKEASEPVLLPSAPDSRQATGSGDTDAVEPASQNTLTPDDMEPAWRGPRNDRNA